MSGESELLRAQDYALKLLSYRERGRKEIQVRMERKAFEKDVIEKVLTYLETQKYLDDRRFAGFWAHDRLRKGYGKWRVILELREKGVNREIINGVVKEVYGAVDEMKMALDLLNRRGYDLGSREDKGAARRAAQFLGRRGFSFSVINEVMSRMVEY